MRFDDSYIAYVIQIDIFSSSFLCYFTNAATFTSEIFSRTCTLRGKSDVQMTFDDSSILYVNQTHNFSSSFVVVFSVESFSF